jgi:hypothetical protein
MQLDTVNVIEYFEGEIESVRSFSDDEEGLCQAKELFCQCARDNGFSEEVIEVANRLLRNDYQLSIMYSTRKGSRVKLLNAFSFSMIIVNSGDLHWTELELPVVQQMLSGTRFESYIDHVETAAVFSSLLCAVVLETTGLIGDKCSLYWDFVNNEFRIFNGANGAQLTFSSSIAGYIQKKNPESKILYFDLTSERINYA